MRHMAVILVFLLVLLAGCDWRVKGFGTDAGQQTRSAQVSGRDSRTTTIQYISSGPGLMMIGLYQVAYTIIGYYLAKGGLHAGRRVHRAWRSRRTRRRLARISVAGTCRSGWTSHEDPDAP